MDSLRQFSAQASASSQNRDEMSPVDASPYALGFASLEREISACALPVRGELPLWLNGSLIRTAPARFEVGSRALRHWFDGFAMLHAFELCDGVVRYSNRFLKSRSYCEATAKGRLVRGEFMTDPCRSIFGRIMAIFSPRVTDNANVNISVVADELVALTETPMPVRFDAHTLETLGHVHLDPSVSGQISSAHPHYDGRSVYSYVIDVGRRSFYRFFVDANARQRLLASVPVAQPSYLHSVGMSERYLVLVEFPLRVNPLRLALSGKPFITNYRWQPELRTQFTVIDKSTGTVVTRARAAPCFAFHHVNAHEADGALLVDLLAFPDAEIIENLQLERLRAGLSVRLTSSLTRFRIPLETSTNANGADVEQRVLCETPFELPRIDYLRRAGKPYRFVWGVAQSVPESFLDTIVKVDIAEAAAARVTSWSEPGCFAGEPVFVARPEGAAEDDGVLLSVVLDTARRNSFLLVLNAADLSEIARAEVPHHIPFGFHGNYFSAATLRALARA
jgi:beta,beta-carotene 9',10'-dioxygenase